MVALRNRLAVVPARGGSKRLPRKNIKMIGGSPSIIHVLNTIAKTELFHEIHVSTEDHEILSLVSEFGYDPVFTRPKSLAEDDVPIADVLKFVTEEYAKIGFSFSTTAIIFPTALFLDAVELADAVAKFELLPGEGREMLSVQRYPVPVEWSYNLDANGELIAKNPEKLKLQSQLLDESFYESGQFVLYDEARISIGKSEQHYKKYGYELASFAVDIDNERDWELAERLFQQ